MALLGTLIGPAHAKKYVDIAGNATKESYAGAKTLFAAIVDNRNNSHAVFLKIWNVATASVTVGTTAPHIVRRIPAGEKHEQFFGGAGLALGTDLTYAIIKEVDATDGPGTSGTTGPTNDVPVTFFTN